MQVHLGALARACGIVATAIAVTPATLRRHALRTMALGICLLAGAAWAGSASYYYDELGRLVETVAADGTSVLYSYDAVGNITSVKHDAVSAVGVAGFSPASGPVGTSVTVFGSGFNTTAASNVVKFNGVGATVTTATATTLTVTVPSGATTGTVSVTNGPASATSSLSFTVAASGAPTIASFTPAIGIQGTAVTLTGTNFQTALQTDKVLFGTITASANSATATTLATSVPSAAASGKISVTTPYGVATSAADFFAVPVGYNVADVQFTGRLSVGGSPLVVTTTVAGKIGLVLFDGIVGQSGAYLELSSVTMPGGTVAVFSPDGSQLGSWPISNGAVISLPMLPKTGPYTVVMAPSGPGSASIQIGTVDLKISGLVVGALTANADHTWSIPVSFTVTNIGTLTTTAPNWWDVGYLSANGVLDANSQTSSALNTRTTPLAPGAQYTVNATFTTNNATAAGTYTFFVKADGHNDNHTDIGNMVEVSETNNVASATVKLDADLAISGLVLGTPVSNADQTWSIPVTYTVTNIGTSATAAASWWDVGYLSANGVLDANSQISAALNTQTAPLAPGAHYTANATFTTNNTTAAGTYTLFVKADGHNDNHTDNGNLTEANEANNVASVAVNLNVDLAISGLVLGAPTANADLTWSIPVSFTVTNSGSLPIATSWWDVGYLSANGVLDANSQTSAALNTRTTPLAPGAHYTVNATFTTNSSTPGGTYTLFVKADGHNNYHTDNGNVTEVNETNNVASATVKLDADLAISGLVVGAPTANADLTWSIPVTYTVTNIGTSATAAASWWDVGYLSANGVLDANSQTSAALNTQTAPLAPGAHYTVNATFTTSNTTAAGTYTLFVKADGHNNNHTDSGNVAEVNEANNVASATVKLDADLAISGLVLGAPVANADHTWSIPVTYTVTNIGTSATVAASWWDVGYLSANGVLDANSQTSAALNTQTTPLVPGAHYTVNATFTTSNTTAAGTYTLFVKADGHNNNHTDSGNVAEANETNNVASTLVTLH